MRNIINTGSPISLIPRKLAKKQKLENKKPAPKDSKFVDLNDDSVEAKRICDADTTFWGNTQRMEYENKLTAHSGVRQLRKAWNKVGVSKYQEQPYNVVKE